MRSFLFAILMVFMACGIVWGLAEPHYKHKAVSCSSCHDFTGGSVGPHSTKRLDNYELCRDCHNEASQKAAALPFKDEFKNYTVGISGAFHKWDVYTSNSNFGASAPTNPEMLRVINSYGDGKIVCSVCHNQHANSELRTAGRLRKSPVRSTDPGEPGATGTIDYDVTPGASPGAWYIEIVTAGTELTATYKISPTYSYPISLYWKGWTDGTWVRYNGSNARQATGDWQYVDNDLKVKIKLTGGDYTVGQQWGFYYGYPLLRAFPDSGDNATGKRFCRDCHAQRAQTHYRAGNVWDGQMKSHPVGVPLNANGGGYDRKPLDVDGVQQGVSADSNTTNDLLLFGDYTAMLTTFGNLSSGDVQCMTCHAPHWTDSNSQTVDLR